MFKALGEARHFATIQFPGFRPFVFVEPNAFKFAQANNSFAVVCGFCCFSTGLIEVARGRERVVRCEKCGREVRRDKAVFIEKAIFSNPLDRKDVTEPDAYRRSFFREVAYCPGCGKHLRIYEKKIKQNIRNQERAERRPFHAGPRKGFRKWSEKEVEKTEERPKVVESKTVGEMSAGSAEFGESGEAGKEGETQGGEAASGGEEKAENA